MFPVALCALALTFALVAFAHFRRAATQTASSESSKDSSDKMVAAPPPPPLNWKPVRIVPVDWFRGPDREGMIEETETEIVLHTSGYKDFLGEDTEGCTNFTLADLKPDVSVLGGGRTAGWFTIAVITGWKEGQYMRIDGPNQGSMLWNNLILFRGPAIERMQAAHAKKQHDMERLCKAWQKKRDEGYDGAATPPVDYDSEGELPPPPPCRRTDSGANYGFSGRPDWDFWKRSGCRLFWTVTPDDYSDWRGDAHEFYAERIEELRQRLAEGRYESDLEREAMEQQAEWMEIQTIVREAARQVEEDAPAAE